MGEPRLAERRKSASSMEPALLYKSRTWEGLDRPFSLFPPRTVTDPLAAPVGKEAVGPFPKELVGDMLNMAPPDMEAFSLKVPFDEESCKGLSEEGLRLPEVLSSKLVDTLSMAESRAPLALKNCPSPKLSKDWLKSEKEGAMSREFVSCGGDMVSPAAPVAWLLGLG